MDKINNLPLTEKKGQGHSRKVRKKEQSNFRK